MFRRHSYPSERAQTFQNIPGSFLITKPEPFHARDLVQHLKHFIYHGKRTYPLNIAEVTPFHDEKVIKDHFNVIDVAISDILGQVAVTVSRLKTYEQSLLGQPSQKKKIGGGRGWCRVVRSIKEDNTEVLLHIYDLEEAILDHVMECLVANSPNGTIFLRNLRSKNVSSLPMSDVDYLDESNLADPP